MKMKQLFAVACVVVATCCILLVVPRSLQAQCSLASPDGVLRWNNDTTLTITTADCSVETEIDHDVIYPQWYRIDWTGGIIEVRGWFSSDLAEVAIILLDAEGEVVREISDGDRGITIADTLALPAGRYYLLLVTVLDRQTPKAWGHIGYSDVRGLKSGSLRERNCTHSTSEPVRTGFHYPRTLLRAGRGCTIEDIETSPGKTDDGRDLAMYRLNLTSTQTVTIELGPNGECCSDVVAAVLSGRFARKLATRDDIRADRAVPVTKALGIFKMGEPLTMTLSWGDYYIAVVPDEQERSGGYDLKLTVVTR
jgi:hypothetical protein